MPRVPNPSPSASKLASDEAPVSRRASGVSATEAADEKREAILEAALDLFAERGFYGTAIPPLAERAKVAAGTIYRYFENKEAIVNALYQKQKQAFSTAVLGQFPFDSPPRDQFHYFWTKCCAFAKSHPKALAFLELHHHQSYLDDTSRALEENVLGYAYAFFKMTADQKVTKPYPPEVLGSVVWGSFVGLMRACWEKRIDLSDETIEQTENCVWEAIRR